jgi:hypothetical protein
VLGLVVGYSGEASSDVHRAADLVATRLPRSTSNTSGRRSQSQRRCEPSASAAPGSLLCTRIRAAHLGLRARQPGPGTRLSHLESELDADAKFNFFYPPSAGEGSFQRFRSGLFPCVDGG